MTVVKTEKIDVDLGKDTRALVRLGGYAWIEYENKSWLAKKLLNVFKEYFRPVVKHDPNEFLYMKENAIYKLIIPDNIKNKLEGYVTLEFDTQK